MKVVFEDHPKHIPTPLQQMRRFEKNRILAKHRNDLVMQNIRTDKHTRLKIVEQALERGLTPGLRDTAMKERQRIMQYINPDG